MTDMKMKLVIFGGTFDPPHDGHKEIHDYLKLIADEVLVMPNYIPPHKSQYSSVAHRINMLKMLMPDAKISTFEIDKGGESYTWQTLQHFVKTNNYIALDVGFVVGADSVHNMHTWSEPALLAQLATFLVIERPGYKNLDKDIENFTSQYGGVFIKTGLKGPDISSTEIRIKNAFGSVSNIIPPGIAAYIKANRLYTSYDYIVSRLGEMGFDKALTDHTKEVAVMAAKLAQFYGVDTEKAVTAALLHDIAKKMDIAGAKARGVALPAGLENIPHNCQHAIIGAAVAKDLFGIKDIDVLRAIRYHTTGRVEMTMLEKVIFVADFIEPRRTFAEAAQARKIALENIDEAVFIALNSTLKHLKTQSGPIEKNTVEAFEYYKILLGKV